MVDGGVDAKARTFKRVAKGCWMDALDFCSIFFRRKEVNKSLRKDQVWEKLKRNCQTGSPNFRKWVLFRSFILHLLRLVPSYHHGHDWQSLVLEENRWTVKHLIFLLIIIGLPSPLYWSSSGHSDVQYISLFLLCNILGFYWQGFLVFFLLPLSTWIHWNGNLPLALNAFYVHWNMNHCSRMSCKLLDKKMRYDIPFYWSASLVTLFFCFSSSHLKMKYKKALSPSKQIPEDDP